MLTTETAIQFATDWIAAFNSHDLQRILEHYEEDVEFHSPFIQSLGFNDEGVIRNKADLARYFALGLKAYPQLHFEFGACYQGIRSIVICYTSVNGKQAAETVQLNDRNRAVRVFCHYQ